jgi:transposase
MAHLQRLLPLRLCSRQEACRQPDASAAAIARLYNLNANVVHRWRADDRKAASPKSNDAATLPMPDFIALDVQPEAPDAGPSHPR